METKSQEWIEKTEIRIREAFELFDKDKADAIIQVGLLDIYKWSSLTNTSVFPFPYPTHIQEEVCDRMYPVEIISNDFLWY